MSVGEKVPTQPVDMNGMGIPLAHIQGIDMAYRAPDLTGDQRAALPQPILEGEPGLRDLYWRCWAIAFDKVRHPDPKSGLKPFVDAAFNQNIFQWDTCFMIGFLRYVSRALPIENTLDNFYAKQHDNGQICREINSITGIDFWGADHPSGLNPPLFADSEWQLYKLTGNRDRLKKVLPNLVQYDRWIQANRRHDDGIGYWTTSLASGMDNTPRAYDEGGTDVHLAYGYGWLCLTAQQALSAKRIMQISQTLGRWDLVETYRNEHHSLATYLNEKYWNDDLGCYTDLSPSGKPSRIKTPAALWPLLAGVAPAERVKKTADLFRSKDTFWRPHVIPSLSVDHEIFSSEGNYWHGSVWPPLVFLAVRAFRDNGEWGLAKAIHDNHLSNIEAVYRETGTVWENYSSERLSPGNIARPEFVGWTGCSPLAGLLEMTIGIRAGEEPGHFNWSLTRDDHHGIRQLPFGERGGCDLEYVPEWNKILVSTNEPITLSVTRDNQTYCFDVEAGTSSLALSHIGAA